MIGRIVLFICVLLTVFLPAISGAQQPNRIPTIGYSSVLSPSSDSARLEAFRQGLTELGYVEGQSFSIEPRYAEGKLDRLPKLAGGTSTIRR